MQLLKDRILKDGRALNEHVLLVDSFINHQVDPILMHEIGKELARRFKDSGITKVATIEASGIAPAVMAAAELGVDMLIMKKSTSSILRDGIVQTEVFSFTKNAPYLLTLRADYLCKDDKVLIIDDFLASGKAAIGAIELIEKAGAKVAGIGVVIAKAFQPGLSTLRNMGYHVEALAPVTHMDTNVIKFD